MLHHLGASGALLWATCSLAASGFLVGHLVLVVPRVVPHVRAGTWGRVPAALNVIFPATFLTCLVTQVLNSVALGLERSHGGYLLGLFLLIAASGFNFFALLVALRRSDAEVGT